VSRVSKCPVENAKNTQITPKNATFSIVTTTFNIESANISNYYYFPHVTKQDYDRAFENTRKEALEHPDLSPTSAARIYHVKEDSLRKSVLRTRNKKRNVTGLYNTHGGNNKILSEAQEEAIRQYCYEQWEAGLGATHQMVFAAISHLRAVRPIFLILYYLSN
jgi:hypothetical protein